MSPGPTHAAARRSTLPGDHSFAYHGEESDDAHPCCWVRVPWSARLRRRRRSGAAPAVAPLRRHAHRRGADRGEAVGHRSAKRLRHSENGARQGGGRLQRVGDQAVGRRERARAGAARRKVRPHRKEGGRRLERSHAHQCGGGRASPGRTGSQGGRREGVVAEGLPRIPQEVAALHRRGHVRGGGQVRAGQGAHRAEKEHSAQGVRSGGVRDSIQGAVGARAARPRPGDADQTEGRREKETVGGHGEGRPTQAGHPTEAGRDRRQYERELSGPRMEVERAQQTARVLVVDDEKVIREILSEFLTMEGYIVRSVEDGADAITELRLRPYDMVISDLKMPKVGGLQLLEQIQAEGIDVLTVIMTGFGTVETAIEAMKKGAYDYILKPFKVEEVVHVVQRGLERQALQAENVRLKEALTLYSVSEAIATSLDIEHVLDVILDAAIREVDGDVATLHLQDPATGQFDERIKALGQVARDADANAPPSPDVDELLGYFQRGEAVLAHGLKANRFFRTRPAGNLVSFVSVPLRVASRVIGTLNVFSFTRGKKFDEGHRKMLSILASRAATSIENARLYEDLVVKNRDLEAANLSLEENFRQTIVGFAHALEESDRYTRGHSDRVAEYARLIAEGLTLPDDDVQTVVRAALLHDIGKIGIKSEKLNKPGKLTPEEVEMFREHPDKGKRILEPIPFMRNLIDGCWCHHEQFDGGGYPRGIAGQNIPLLGRIVAVADAYDAMTSDRAYRKALPHQVAVDEIERCAGTQFDPEVAEVFLKLIEDHRAALAAAGHPIPR
ncbi:MAG: response regulator [Deltaproteobacteria bacterium]|nr:MAG: response regulator [Deltaproteobacteria bacterium]